MTETIVLAHGFLGFGEIPGLPSRVEYFKGLASHLRTQGRYVIEPMVNPTGSVRLRGAQLADAIRRQTPDAGTVHILAHSMGGLDARFALANDRQLAARTATLVTIGTPHRGSPVADAIESRTGPLFDHIPPFILDAFGQDAGALHDLTTPVCIEFDERTPDVGGIRYVEVAGDASLGERELLLLRLAAALGQLTGEVNDGVVTRSSALRAGHEHLDDWPVDHLGEVGWGVPSLSALLRSPSPESSHLARYDAIVGML